SDKRAGVVDREIPLCEQLAGRVSVLDQPIIVSDESADESVAGDVAEGVGVDDLAVVDTDEATIAVVENRERGGILAHAGDGHGGVRLKDVAAVDPGQSAGGRDTKDGRATQAVGRARGK